VFSSHLLRFLSHAFKLAVTLFATIAQAINLADWSHRERGASTSGLPPAKGGMSRYHPAIKSNDEHGFIRSTGKCHTYLCFVESVGMKPTLPSGSRMSSQSPATAVTFS
jgi:hypothetical protein